MSRTADRSIVAGVGGSAAAETVALWAAAEADRRHAELKLVYATDPTGAVFASGYTPPEDFFLSLREMAQHRLEEVQAAVEKEFPDLPVTISMHSDSPVAVLLEHSRTAALLAVGAVEATRTQRLFGATTAISVAAHADCPVAVVHDGTARPDENAPIVVGIDGSADSEAATGLAFEEASLRRAPLIAVHGWNLYVSDAEYLRARQAIWDWDSVEEQERETLAERLAGWQEKYPDVHVQRVVARERAAELLLFQAKKAQLLLVGSRGHGGFAGRLLGSVGQKLIHRAQCPVIVARSR